MPYQIKNGIIYSGNAVTLTQAQYDALTTAEKNNGTVYYIYDSDAMIEAHEVGLDGGNVETLAGSVATIEASPATAAHAVGSYILWNGQLYEVTSAIAVGETLTVGTNITSTNVGSELTALNNGLPKFDAYVDISAVSQGGTFTVPKTGFYMIYANPNTSSGYTQVIIRIGIYTVGGVYTAGGALGTQMTYLEVGKEYTLTTKTNIRNLYLYY